LPSDQFHFNGPCDGGWCVIDGWTSKAARDEFLETHILPAVASMPLTGEPTIEDLTVEATLQGWVATRTKMIDSARRTDEAFGLAARWLRSRHARTW
jgi:hypothetical protein